MKKFILACLLLLTSLTFGQISITAHNTDVNTNFNGWNGTLPTGYTNSGNGAAYKGTSAAGTAGGTYAVASNGYGWKASSGANALNLTGTFTNLTGSNITELEISYEAFNITAAASRLPGWTVTSTTTGLGSIGALNWAYNASSSNISPDLQTITVTGLNIANNGSFNLNFFSDRGTGSGSSPMIGLNNINVKSIASTSTNPTVTITTSASSGSEALASVITLTATASAAVSGNQTVDISVAGTGVSGTDYTLSSGTITILDGALQGTATFTILDDTDVEGTETATATISNPSSGIVIGFPSSQDITITDNDFNPEVSLTTDVSAGTEVGQTVVTVTAASTYAVLGNQTVDLNVSGTGITIGDYTLSASQITILSGQTTGTVTFTIVDDADQEGTETAILTISNPSSGLTLGGTLSADIIITDDDLVVYDLIINEILADPNDDANGDGTYNSSADEFVEIYNNENTSVDLTGYTISDAVQVRHTFPTGSIVPAKSFITVFGAGTPTNIPGITQISSTTQLGLNNGGDGVILKHSAGITIASYSFGAEGSNNVSLGRSPDFVGAFGLHDTIFAPGRSHSPGVANITNTATQVLYWCNQTLTALNTTIYVAEVQNADEYFFEVSVGGIVIDTIAKPVRNFQLIELPGGATFGTVYAIRAAVRIGTTTYPFGVACTASTPSLPLSQLRPAYCDASISALSASIYAVYHAGVTAWKFKISHAGTTDSIVKTNTGYFSLTELSTIIAAYGTTYTISVATQVGGMFGAYGPACTVTTPAAPISQLRPAYCGVNIPTLSSSIYAVYFPGVTKWRFKVSIGGVTDSIDKTNTGYFNLSELTTITAAYGTTYTISVAMETGGAFGAYGSTCTITTPSVPTSQLRPAYCGANLSQLSASIYAVYYPGVTKWRFKVSNGTVTDSVDKTNSGYFNLNEFTAFTAAYGTPYTVSVAMEIGGAFGAYGSPCTITTPSLPVSQLRPGWCNGTIAHIGASIYAVYYPGVTKWRFKISDGTVTDSVDKTNTGNFTLSELTTLVAAAGTPYTIQVAMEINGVMGTYGTGCIVTVPSASPREPRAENETENRVVSINKSAFEITAYPNPFQSKIRIDVTSEEKSTVAIIVFDPTGRIIETKEIDTNNGSSFEIGENYLPGVYQIQLLQNGRIEIIRVVKK